MNFNFIFVVVILHSFVVVVVAGLKRCIIIFLFFVRWQRLVRWLLRFVVFLLVAQKKNNS